MSDAEDGGDERVVPREERWLDTERVASPAERRRWLDRYRRDARQHRTGAHLFCPHGEHAKAPCEQCGDERRRIADGEG